MNDQLGSNSGKGREDNFDNLIANPLTDLLDVAGEKDFTPERLRLYANGSRIYLQYGDDPRYEESPAGHILKPGEDEVLTMPTAERVAYPVGYDLITSMAFELSQAPQPGDVAGGGLGRLDLANFDPSTEEYSGSNADGYFWYFTNQTGLSSALLAGVRDGTIFYKRRVPLQKPGDVWSILAGWVNWYDVGPCVWHQRYTDIENNPNDPQQNDIIGAVANDDGKAALIGSHRVRMSVYQAAGNSGLELEAGSLGVSVPGRFDYKFKKKSHSHTVNVTDATDEQYQFVGAMRTDPARQTIKLQIRDVSVVSRPSDTANVDVLVQSISPEETSFLSGDFETPAEHSDKNSVVEIATDNTATGPLADAAGTDATGADTGNTTTDPGGYQIYRDSISQTSGQGNDETSTRGGVGGVRSVYDLDWAIIALDADETGDYELDFVTAQNS